MRLISTILIFAYSVTATAGPYQHFESFFKQIRDVGQFKEFVQGSDLERDPKERLLRPLNRLAPRMILPFVSFEKASLLLDDGVRRWQIRAFPKQSAIDINGRLLAISRTDFEGNIVRISRELARGKLHSYVDLFFPRAEALDGKSLMMGMMIAGLIPMLMGGESPMMALMPLMMVGAPLGR
jgi:hypothetical protein